MINFIPLKEVHAPETEVIDRNERRSSADAFRLDSRYHINNISIDIWKHHVSYNAVSITVK